MKRYILFVVLDCLLIAAVSFHFNESEEANEPFSYRFTFVCPMRWNSVAGGMSAADEALGTNTKLIGFENLNEDLRVEEIQKAVYSNVSGIITSGMDASEQTAEVIAAAESAGIPVLLIDADLPDSMRACYIGMDHFAAGEMAGEDMLEATDGEAQIGVIAAHLDDCNQRQRVEGFYTVINEQPGMEIAEELECESDRMKIRKLVQQMLLDHPEMDAIYCVDEIAAGMIGEILEESGFQINEIKVVCFGIDDEIDRFLKEGWYYSTIALDQYELGYQAVAWLRAYLNGLVQTDDIIYMETRSIRADEDFASWKAQWAQRGEVWNLK